ncbi:hypothetical protein [Bacillus pretiosus]|uniref:hypothetical protein n=1 Tax=Bacillus pretiosus TaxID=2983392 RepID=UPI003D64E821
MNNKIKVKTFSTEEHKKARHFYANERLFSAKPIPSPVKTKGENENNLSSINQNTKDLELISPEPPINSEETNKNTATGNPFPPDINLSPYKCASKIFFKKGTDLYSGTAQFVANTNVILTAAHCLVDSETGKYYEDIHFIRGYKKVGTTVQGERFDFDYSAIYDA